MLHKEYDNIAHVDFECFYDSKTGYSLTKMPTINYCRDPRFKSLGCAVAWNDEPCTYLTHEEFTEWAESVDWSRTAVSAHNTLFDGTVLTQQYGIFPAYYMCTLSAARALLPIDRHGLKVVAPLLGLGDKGDALISGSKDTTDALRVYAIQDNNLARGIQKMLYPMLSAAEQDIISLTIRQGVEPTLILDREVLLQVRDDAVRERNLAILNSGQSETVLTSNPQFAKLIRSMGLTPPTKLSEATGEETEAFANGDAEWVAFKLEYPQFKHIWDGRLAAKSNINITRADKFLSIESLSTDGTTPIPTNYHGAKTGRSSGADGMNCFTGDHEVLTPSGWVRIDQWEPKQEPIAQWWPNGDITWDAHARNNSFPSPATMVEVTSPAVRGIFTADHRFVARNKYGRVIERTAGWVSTHSGLDGMIPFGMLTQIGSGITPAQARALVCLAADGSIVPRAKSWGAIQWGFHKERKAIRLRSILEGAQVEFTERRYGKRFSFLVSNPPEWLQTKGFGKWVLNLSPETSDALLDELVHWDGFVNSNNGADTFCTTVKEQAEWVQTLAHIRGRRASLYAWTRSTNYSCAPLTVYNVYFGTSKYTSIDTKRQVRTITSTSSTVYCPTVDSSYILVRYAGAIHVTGQCQNLPNKYKSNIRKAFTAPKGQVIVTVDSAQIELRVNAWLCGQQNVLDTLINGRDVYKLEASNQFNVPYEEVTNDQRSYGKLCMLGLGYGMGAKKFQLTAAAGPLGMPPIYRTMEEAYDTVNKYRASNSRIPAMWRILDQRIHQMTLPGLCEKQGVLTFMHEGIALPSGRMLQYPGLMQTEEGQWVYGIDKKTHFLWGGTVDEQLCQSLARDIVFTQMLEVDKRYRVVSSTHDEISYCAPEKEADEALAFGIEVFSQSPEWAPDLPVSAEGAYASYYCK